MSAQVRSHWFDPLPAPWIYLGSNADGNLRQDVYFTERGERVWLRIERHPQASIEEALADWTAEPQILDRARRLALELYGLWRFVHQQQSTVPRGGGTATSGM